MDEVDVVIVEFVVMDYNNYQYKLITDVRKEKFLHLKGYSFFFEILPAFHFFSLILDYSKDREEGYSKKIDDTPD